MALRSFYRKFIGAFKHAWLTLYMILPVKSKDKKPVMRVIFKKKDLDKH